MYTVPKMGQNYPSVYGNKSLGDKFPSNSGENDAFFPAFWKLSRPGDFCSSLKHSKIGPVFCPLHFIFFICIYKDELVVLRRHYYLLDLRKLQIISIKANYQLSFIVLPKTKLTEIKHGETSYPGDSQWR